MDTTKIKKLLGEIAEEISEKSSFIDFLYEKFFRLSPEKEVCIILGRDYIDEYRGDNLFIKKTPFVEANIMTPYGEVKYLIVDRGIEKTKFIVL